MLEAKAAAVWLLILLCAFLNGALRELVLVPAFGRPAGLMASGLLLSACVLGTSILCVPWFGGLGTARYLSVGLLWLCLTLAFEFGFGRLMQHKSWSELFEAYTFAGGNLWLLVLVVILFAPLIAARVRGRPDRAEGVDEALTGKPPAYATWRSGPMGPGHRERREAPRSDRGDACRATQARLQRLRDDESRGSPGSSPTGASIVTIRLQLTLFVPRSASAQLEALRSRLDPVQTGLIAAHVTLCRADEIADLVEADLRSRLEAGPGGPITFRFGSPQPSHGHGILLSCIAGDDAFGTLRRRVLGRVEVRPCAPHITLAHPRNPKSPFNDLRHAAALPHGLTIAFTSVCRIRQDGFAPWRVLERYPLGCPPACV